MNGPAGKLLRCAIYIRKSSEHNLDLAFTSLDAQREACTTLVASTEAQVTLSCRWIYGPWLDYISGDPHVWGIVAPRALLVSSSLTAGRICCGQCSKSLGLRVERWR